ncbi:MAG TPA: alcohol dehydrogenase catalytic domain-containing protein, partial [Candidatus Cybelea sp.]|nr:alcohol dehydrogenase catalytic domain-containing protein [Candidatus Cybelea sp.]
MLVAPRQIELREEPTPPAPSGGMVVRIRAALTDGTDLKTYRRGHPKMPMPTRFGHEFCGDVIAVAEGVEAFAAGDPVMCVHTAPCGECYWCRYGQEELCEDLMPAMLLGAYADYIALPRRIVERNAFRKPPGVTYPEGAFLEPLACVVHSVAMLAPQPGASIAILGNGGFGILHALVLQRAGANAMIFGRRPERIELARSLGLQSLDASAAPIEEAILERTDGRGADVAIECTGTAELWEAAPALVRRGGTVSFFAGLPAETRV